MLGSLDTAGTDAREAGRVPVYVGWDGVVRGTLAVGDEVRDGWEAVVEEPMADGRRVVVLTDDSPAAAQRFEEYPAIDEVFAEVPPEGKAETVRRLSATERVTMVVPIAVSGALNPLFAAVAMATSSLLVVSNSARAVYKGE